jgi:hypothetical protein
MWLAKNVTEETSNLFKELRDIFPFRNKGLRTHVDRVIIVRSVGLQRGGRKPHHISLVAYSAVGYIRNINYTRS